MKNSLRRLVLLAAALVAGCVAYSPTIDKAAAPKPGMAYLTGVFIDASVLSGGLIQRRLGITFENKDNLTQHTVQFQTDGRDLQLIEVPPGTYRVPSWFMANTMNEGLVRGKPRGNLLTRDCKVPADQAYCLGQ